MGHHKSASEVPHLSYKHTTAFHKLSETNRCLTLKHLRQYWGYGNWLVISNTGGRWTFLNWGDIGLSPASREITQMSTPSKHYTNTWDQKISSSQRGNIPNGLVPLLEYKFQQATPDLTRPEGKCDKNRRWKASGWQISRLPGLFAVKMIWQQITITNRIARKSTTTTNKRRQ